MRTDEIIDVRLIIIEMSFLEQKLEKKDENKVKVKINRFGPA